MKRALHLVAAALALSPACSTEPLPADTAAPEVELESQALTNANVMTSNPINTAIYHFKRSGECTPAYGDTITTPYPTMNIFWPRPCSGRVIRRTGNEFLILTARHCVTQNGKVAGPLPFTASDLIVHTSLAPGVIDTTEMPGSITVHGSPPPGGATATVIAAGTPANEGDTAHDRAIIRASNLNITSGRTAIYSGTASELVGLHTTAEGYGRSEVGHCYGHNGSGAGVLRQGFGFTITSADTGWFAHNEDSTFTPGQHKRGGDSGSPIHYMNQINGMRWLLGVTSTPVTAAGGVDIRQWLQDSAGHIFLANIDKYRNSSHLVGAQQFAGGTVGYIFTGDVPETRLRYEGATLQLKFGNFCIRDNGGGGVTSENCNANDVTQKWIYTQNISRLQNMASGRCMDQGAAINTMPCQHKTSQSWVFLTDDDPLAAGL